MPPVLAPGVVEYLEINNYPVANYCNRFQSITGMRKVEYKLATAQAPYTNGIETFPGYLDGLTIVVPGFMFGEVASDGTPIANPRVGLETNYEEFYAAVLAPVSTGDGTRAVEWHKATGAVWTGLVQVGPFDPRDHDQDAGRMDYSLTLTFKAGRLTPP